jgi:hypothetical protein
VHAAMSALGQKRTSAHRERKAAERRPLEIELASAALIRHSGLSGGIGQSLGRFHMRYAMGLLTPP